VIAVAERCKMLHCRREEHEAEQRYDRIVSGLPLNNFATDEVRQILDVFRRLAKPGGILSFFEYVAVRRAKRLVSGRSERQRLSEISSLIGGLADREIRRDCVLWNVTPAWVPHIKW